MQQPQAPQAPPTRPAETPPPTSAKTARPAAAQLFDQLFPGGIRMTADVLADFERWTELTERLIAYADTL